MFYCRNAEGLKVAKNEVTAAAGGSNKAGGMTVASGRKGIALVNVSEGSAVGRDCPFVPGGRSTTGAFKGNGDGLSRKRPPLEVEQSFKPFCA